MISPCLLRFTLMIQCRLSMLGSDVSMGISTSVPLLLRPIRLSPSIRGNTCLYPNTFSTTTILPKSSLLACSSNISSLRVAFSLDFPIRMLNCFYNGHIQRPTTGLLYIWFHQKLYSCHIWDTKLFS